MNEELFPAEAVAMDSPRLAWMKKHEVRTHHSQHCEELPWCAWFPENEYEEGGIPKDPEACGYGTTEDEAVTALAVIFGVPLWNEEAAP